jgi:Family of unknown function (DUF6183)
VTLTTADLVEIGDLDALLVRIDHLCADRDWRGVLDLRDRCRKALERGRQLWPAASHAEYRLALEAPGREAAAVLVPGAGRFALGPLAEVAASTHTWAELGPHLPATPEAGLVAHERVVRGEDLTAEVDRVPPALELPLRLQPWEPEYLLPTYRAHELETPSLPAVELRPLTIPAADLDTGTPVADPEPCRALAELALVWKQESNGTVEVAAVDGGAASAVAAVCAAGAEGLGGLLLAEVGRAHAMAAMADTAASGGAHGRRRGMAAGRFGAWWALAALTGQLDVWPFEPDELGAASAALRWYRWEGAAAPTGWSLRLAVEDPARGRAWAVSATDRR